MASGLLGFDLGRPTTADVRNRYRDSGGFGEGVGDVLLCRLFEDSAQEAMLSCWSAAWEAKLVATINAAPITAVLSFSLIICSPRT